MNITIWITSNCNMKCKYCYEKNKEHKVIQCRTIDASVAFFRNRIKNSTERVHVRIHGGEPLLYYDLVEYIIKTYKSSFKDMIDFEITTNATLLTSYIAMNLNREMTHIGISIDGDSESHNMNRVFQNGESTYDVVEQKIKLFPDLHAGISARMTITPETVKSLYDNVRHLVELGFKTIEPVPDVFSSSWSKETAHILQEEFIKLARYQKEKGSMVEIYGIDAARKKVKNAVCNGGVSSFHIDTDGNVYPCLLSVGIEKYCLGSVFSPYIFNTSLLQKITDWDKESMISCSGCSRYNYCEATRCKIINEIYTGDRNTPIPMMCAMTNIQYNTCQYFQKCKNIT